MREKYIEAFTAIISAEQEIQAAKKQLVAGNSPYVSLSVARNQCDRAMALWHKAKGWVENDKA